MERATEKIWLARPEMMGNEALYVQKSLESGWITSAYNEESYIGKFERSVEGFLKFGKAVAVNSGTSAIHLALLMAGVQKGDMVFCSDLTFAASANPIRYIGAEPVFIDSEMDTMNMDPDALEKAFSTGLLPKAVIVVHVYGTPANMDRIMNICSRYGVPVIEDATESFGAVADGEMVGTIGDFGCLSFNGNKMITAGGTGGMLICRNEEEARRAAFIAYFHVLHPFLTVLNISESFVLLYTNFLYQHYFPRNCDVHILFSVQVLLSVIYEPSSQEFFFHALHYLS